MWLSARRRTSDSLASFVFVLVFQTSSLALLCSMANAQKFYFKLENSLLRCLALCAIDASDGAHIEFGVCVWGSTKLDLNIRMCFDKNNKKLAFSRCLS